MIDHNKVGAAWLFALLGGPACEKFGRKPVILGASLVFIIGAIVMAVSVSKEVCFDFNLSVFIVSIFMAKMKGVVGWPADCGRWNRVGLDERAGLHQVG